MNDEIPSDASWRGKTAAMFGRFQVGLMHPNVSSRAAPEMSPLQWQPMFENHGHLLEAPGAPSDMEVAKWSERSSTPAQRPPAGQQPEG